MNYLIHLVDSVVSIINFEHYGRIVRDLYLRRQLIDVGESIVNKARDSILKESAETQIEDAEKSYLIWR